MLKIPFDNTYFRLPSHFYDQVLPSANKSPSLITYNSELGETLGIDTTRANNQDLAEIFSGKTIVTGSNPIALAYAGHQFGHFVPQLGDGRAVLLGEVVNSKNERFDLQLKGAGATKFSRGGDGRSAIGPVIREYILSEAMYALGVPTTRALAAVATGERVLREGDLPGAILTRVAKSHIRIGTFEYFAHQGSPEDLQVLTDYAIRRHDPDLVGEKDNVNTFFLRIAHRNLKLVVQWMCLGFIHGVMNTDNTSIAGETIDYGPCAFMDEFHRDKVFSSIDRRGRYAYSNQGQIAIWNLSVLAKSLLPLLIRNDETEEEAILRLQDTFNNLNETFQNLYLTSMTKKLGILQPQKSDHQLLDEFLILLQNNNLDFTNSFRNLNRGEFENVKFLKAWQKRMAQQGTHLSQVKILMDQANPYIVPRNHQVQKAIIEAQEGRFEYFHMLTKAYKQPYIENSEHKELTILPQPEERVTKTFCGT